MLYLLRFTIVSNLIALALVAPCYLLIPFVHAYKPIDLMFLTGVLFWLISTVVRISTKRFKKEWQRNEVIVTDPQIVIHSNSWAFRFLIAGIPGIAGSIIWGTLAY